MSIDGEYLHSVNKIGWLVKLHEKNGFYLNAHISQPIYIHAKSSTGLTVTDDWFLLLHS